GMARQRLLCYVNADIILLDDFLEAMARIPYARFLAVGQRWNIALERPWDFAVPGWQGNLRRRVAAHGALHPPVGSDFFVFPHGCGLEKLPPFAVGRQGWDNWMIYRARQLQVPVIDATPAATVIHQNHDYAHVPSGDGNSYQGIESREN